MTGELPVLAAMQRLGQARRALAESLGRRQVSLIAAYKALGYDSSLAMTMAAR